LTQLEISWVSVQSNPSIIQSNHLRQWQQKPIRNQGDLPLG
jgi:hypothetical protein